VACLVAQKENKEALKWCFQQGATFDNYLNRACQMGAQTPEMLQLLLELNWEGIRDSKNAVDEQIEFFGVDSMQGAWLRAHAAKQTTPGHLDSQSHGKGPQQKHPYPEMAKPGEKKSGMSVEDVKRILDTTPDHPLR
jgi:hypothetical protein